MKVGLILIVLVFGFAFFNGASGVDIPITVTILNAEPEILDVQEPEVVPLGQPFNISLTVRDNNTLADIVTAVGWGEGYDAVGYLVSNSSLGVGTFIFPFVAPDVPDPGEENFDGTVVVGDEALNVSYNFCIPYVFEFDIVPVTESIEVSLKPGMSTSGTVLIYVRADSDVKMYASKGSSPLIVSVNGVEMTEDWKVVSTYGPVDGDVTLEVSVTAPIPFPRQNIEGVLKVGLGSSASDVPDIYSSIGVTSDKLKGPPRVDMFWGTLGIAGILGTMFLLEMGRRYRYR
jgi:hypothetical protein